MKVKHLTQAQVVASVRRDFSALNLKTRCIPDKTKYSRKNKFKKDY